MARRDGTATTQTFILELAAGPERDEAWSCFVSVYGPLMRGWCRDMGMTPGESEDVADSVLARLVQKIGTFRGDQGRGFQPWLRAVVENAVRDHRRHDRRHPGDRGRGGDDPGPDTLPTGPDPLGRGRTVEQLVDGISLYLDDDYVRAFRDVRARHHPITDGTATPTKSWQAYELLCIQERTVAEVAAALKMTPAAVSSAAFRVKSELNAEYDRRVAARGGRS